MNTLPCSIAFRVTPDTCSTSCQTRMSHSHKVKIALSVDEIKSVPGLEERLPATIDLTKETPKAWGCSNGACQWVKIFRVPFFVDFTSNTILDDPDSRPCEGATAKAGATGGTTVTRAQKAIKHARVDPVASLDKFRQEALTRPPQMSIHDETLMTEVGADKALQMQFPDKIPPQSFLVALRTLAIQVDELIAAHNAAIASAATKDQEKKVKSVTIRASAVATGAGNTNVSIDVFIKNTVFLGCLLRGLLEFADHAQLMHRTIYNTVNFHSFMTQLSTNMRPDVAEITAVIQSPEEVIKDISARLDGNTFYVAGVLATTRNKPAMEEFFRKESGRFVSVAKACGWKAPEKKADANPKTPKVLGKRTIADSQSTDTVPAATGAAAAAPGKGKSRNAKLRRKKAAAKAAGTSSG